MPYIKKTTIAGRVKEVQKYFSTRYGKKTTREKNLAETTEKQKKINERNAEEKLRGLLNENFIKNDIHSVLTYKKDLRPDPETSKKQIAKFLEKCRAEYKKQGKVFKYICVTEYKKKAIHHHLVINNIDVTVLNKHWPWGKIRTTYIDGENLKELAAYLIKETKETIADGIIKKRWNASRNLAKPKIVKKIVKANSWRKEPVSEKGYVLEKNTVKSGMCEYSGFEYQSYTLIKILGGG